MNLQGSETISGGLSVGGSVTVTGSETISGNLVVAGAHSFSQSYVRHFRSSYAV